MSAPRDGLRVLQLDPEVGYGVRKYRVEHLTEQLERAGVEVRVEGTAELHRAWCDGELDKLVRGVDVLVLHRFAWDVRVAALLEAARREGVTSVFEADDLVFVPGAERWVDGVRHLDEEARELYDRGVDRYAATYRACDAYLGSTGFLGGLRPFGAKRSGVVPNLLGEEQLAIARKIGELEGARDDDAVVLGYGAGSRTHDEDLAQIGAALASVLERRPGVRLELVGPVDLPVELEPYAARITRHELQRWQDWWAILSRWDVALAPLDERNPYCRAKSALKYLEAGVLGVPTVASRTDDFERVVRPGENGQLAGDTSAWVRALEALVDDDALRARLGAAAREDVLQNHTTRAVAARTRAELERLRAARADEPRAHFRGFDLSCLVPSPFPGSGGHSNIFRVLRALGRRGHRCALHADVTHVEGVETADELGAFVDERFLPLGAEYRTGWDLHSTRADALMATSWATAEAVARADAPSRIYFVQDWECMFVAAGEDWVRTERTYRLGLSCITLGRWLTEVMRARYASDSVAFPFPVHIDDAEVSRRPSSHDGLTLAYLAQPSKPRRGYRTGLEALEIFHEQHPEVRIVFFGSRDVDADAVPFPFEDLGILDEAALEELYREVDIGLVLSYSNPSLVPPNMMRCGCVVVDVDLEHNAHEYHHEVDSLLAEPTPWGIAAALSRLAADEGLRTTLAEGARAEVASRSEEASVDVIEAALVRGVVAGHVEPPPQLAWFQGESDGFIGLDQGTVTQVVHVECDELCSFSLRVGTYAREAGDVAWRVREVLGHETDTPLLGGAVASGVWRGVELRDNRWHVARFDALADSAGRSFAVEVAMLDRAAPAAALYVLEEGPAEACRLLVNGQPRRGMLQLEMRAVGPGGSAPLVASAPTAVAPATSFEAAIPATETELEPEVLPEGTPVPVAPREAWADPRGPARELARLLQDRARAEQDGGADAERRVRALETSVRGVEETMQRARKLLGFPLLRKPLAALKMVGPTEHFLDGDRFVTPELHGRVRAGQRIEVAEDGLCAVALRFGTDRRKLDGMLRLVLREDRPDAKPLREATLAARKLVDNQFAEFAFDPLPGDAPRRLVVEVDAPLTLRGSGPRLWGRGRGAQRGGERLQEGHRVGGELDLRLRFDRRASAGEAGAAPA